MPAPKYSLPSPVDPPAGESLRTSAFIVLRKEWRETPDRGEPLISRIIRAAGDGLVRTPRNEAVVTTAGEEESR